MSHPARPWLLLGALNGLLTVALGAFGAHVLKTRVIPDLLAVYQTGIHYHGIHALALLAVGLLALYRPCRALTIAGISFTLGILLFSGSLYLLAITGVRGLGAVTPIGGIAFVGGWATLAFAGWSITRRDS